MKSRRKIVYVCCAIAVISGSIIVPITAKYRDRASHKEIAYADSFYFSSDYLSTADDSGLTGGAEYLIQGWDGVTTCDFTFQIRNYDNPMLFNNITQNISYYVEASSTDTDKIDYSVQKLVDNGYSLQLDGSLVGGSAQTDSYKVTIKPKTGVTITDDVAVRVFAKTKPGSPYSKTIATTIVLQKAQSSEFISDKGFEEPNLDSVALNYRIHTTSGVIDTGNTDITNAGKEIHIKWDNTLVSIDEQNSLLQEIKVADENRPQASKKFYYSNGNKTGNLIIEVLPYTSVSILFYKNTLDESDWIDGSDYLWNTKSSQIVDAIEVKP